MPEELEPGSTGLPVDIDATVLGGVPVYSAEDLARLADLPVDELQRIWRSLGFPEIDPAMVAFTDLDAMALALLRTGLDSGLVDFDTAIGMTRALGQTMARLSDWTVTALTPRPAEGASPTRQYADRIQTAQRLLGELGPVFDELLVYSWRRHLAAALNRAAVEPQATEDGSSEPEDTAHVTVGFADLVAFTALSNEIGETRIGDLIEIFESRCHDVVAAAGGRVIKSLGDSVLFVVADPVKALEIAEGIVTVIGRDERMPDVRIGLASGPVSMRLGDVFGPAVNMAARLTGVARRNRVIIDEETASLLPPADFELRRLPARPLRGFGNVEPIAVRRI